MPRSPIEPHSPGRPRALVVLSDPARSAELYDLLHNQGHEIGPPVLDAHAAMVQAAAEPPHLVFVEVNLGGAGLGVELARTLHERHGPAVVFVAARPDESVLAEAVAGLPAAYLTAPFDELGVRLSVAIANERAGSDRARREADSRWARADRVLAAVLEGTPDGVLALNELGQIVLFNRGAEAMFGWSRQDVLGNRLDVLLPEEAAGVHSVLVDTYRSSSDRARPMTTRRPVRARRRDGSTFPIDVALGKAEVPGETLLTATIRDATDRERLTEELLHSQKLDAVGRLAESVAHDFNNLLTVILGASQILAHPGLPADVASEAIRDIDDAGQRGAALVNRLLAFSRPSTGASPGVELDDAVRNAGPLLDRLAPHRVDLRLDLDARGAWVPVDATSLDQVLFNLVSNAAEAMPGGGEIVVRTRLAEGGEKARIDVLDSGPGIPESALPLLFEPYFTTRPNGRGGLGLATVSRVVTRAGGTITASNRPGGGGDFRIDLPLVTAPGPRPRPMPPTRPRGGPPRVLVVSPYPQEAAEVGTLLLQLGRVVVVETSVAAAARRATEGLDQFDVALLDDRIPPPPGESLLDAFRRLLPTARIVSIVAAGASHAAGAPSLPRPVTMADLRAALDPPSLPGPA